MCNLDFSQSLNLYVHIPIIIGSLFLGVFVFLADSKNPINRNLFAFILFLIVWIVNDLLQWMTFDERLILFFSRISILSSLSLLFFLFFSYAFAEKEVSFKKKFLFSLPFIPLILLVFSESNASMEPNGSCDVLLGPLYIYLIAVIIFYMIWSVKVLISFYRKNKENNKIKKQVKIIAIGFALLILWIITILGLTSFSLFVDYSGGDNASLFISVGMLLFIAFTVFAIAKYQLLNIKLLAAQALVMAQFILIGSMFFFASSATNLILISVTLLGTAIMGWFMVRSVKEEVQRKEELQLMSDQLANANDQLRKLDNSKSEFISIASHQLRTPITAIKGFLSLLLEGSYGKINAKQEDALNKTYTSNERLLNLVEDLLNVSRIESGRMEFKLAPTNILDICQEVTDTLAMKARDRKLYLDYQSPKTVLPELMIDGTKVREVISNMVDNALKYTEKGGVTVRVEHGQFPISNFQFPNNDQNKNVQNSNEVREAVRVIVSDTGIGIPEEELPYLFSKFSRGKDVARLNTGGTGLGLYVGKAMIEQNGGKIWAESDGEGKGSRFIVELPVAQDEELMKRWGNQS